MKLVKISGGLLVLAGLLVSGVGRAAEMTGENAPQVVVDLVASVTETTPKRYVGAVESINRVAVMPRITGELRKINFTEGSMVNAGDLLYEIEDTTYLAAVNSLKAQRENLSAALRYADTEFKRNEALLERNAVSVSTFDKALLEIDSAKAQIKQIDALLTDAENNLSYTQIHAPITGRIGKSTFTCGNLIAPAAGALTDIEMIAPIYVRFSLSERAFRKLGGLTDICNRAIVRIQLADDSIYAEEASISLIDNKVNATTNTITVWATFANKDLALLPGGFVTVLLSERYDDARPAVTPSALVTEKDGYCVYVVNSANQVERRVVTLGELAADKQIILSGLNSGETVIVDGTHKATPGGKVTPVTVAEFMTKTGKGR